MSFRCWQEWTSRSPQYVVSCAAGHKAPLAIQHREAPKGCGREINRKLRSEGVKMKVVLEFDNIQTVNMLLRSRMEFSSFRKMRFGMKWRPVCSRPWNSMIPSCSDLWAR